MDVIVTNIIIGIPIVSEPSKPASIKVNCLGAEGCTKNINSKIKFLTSNCLGVVYVSLNYIGLSGGILRFIPEVRLPFLDMGLFVKEENTLSLRPSYGFHDPYGFFVVFRELVFEDCVFTREIVSLREEIDLIMLFTLCVF